MEELSNHTKLMNIVMGLALKIPKWPHPLRDLGYTIDVVEANMPEANPDIILTTKKYNHSIVADCKSNTVDEGQIKKYASIQSDPQILIRRGFVTIPVIKHYSADPTFISFNDLSMIPLVIDNNICSLHVVEKDGNIQKIEFKFGKFQLNDLNAIFPINVAGAKPPYNLYPFDVQDRETFTLYLLRELLTYVLKQTSFTVEELLSSVHPYWSIIHGHKQKEFKTIADRILSELGKSELRDYLQKENIRWNMSVKRDAKSIQAFQKRCNEAIGTIESKLKQTILPLDYSEDMRE